MFQKFVLILVLTHEIIYGSYVDLDILNKNLIESLRLHPKLNGDLTDETKYFIDKYVDDFFDLTVESIEDERYKKSKRSLDVPETYTRDHVGIFTFNGLTLLSEIPIDESVEIEIFECNGNLFAASIKQSEHGGNTFAIFKFENYTLSIIDDSAIKNVSKFFLYNEKGVTYVSIASSNSYDSGIWRFDGKHLKQIQNMNFENISNFRIWSMNDEMHMAVSRRSLDQLNQREADKTIVYKWRESYFDPIQTINKSTNIVRTSNTAFRNLLFLVVNDHMKDMELEYIEIYTYDLQTGLYNILQRIPSHNCKDIKLFRLKKRKGFDDYLVAANSITGSSLKEIPPIIYKFVDGYFLPFQNMKIEHLIEFEHIQTPDDMFLLIARTEFESLKAFQYDGWIFQETSSDINTNLSKMQISYSKMFLVGKVPLLVLSFPKLHQTKIYEINFSHENKLKEFHDGVLNWCEESLSELEGSWGQNDLKKKRQIEDLDEKIDDEKEKELAEADIMSKINTANLMLEQLETQVENSLQSNKTHKFENLIADVIILGNSNISSLIAERINNENIDEILNNLIDINKDTQWPDNLILDHVLIDSKINPRMINKRAFSEIIHLGDDLEIGEITVRGKVVMKDLKTNTLNNLPFNKENIFLKNEDQFFEDIVMHDVHVDNLRIETMNSRNIRNLEVSNQTRGDVEHIASLKAKKLVIGGFINDVDMRTLDKYSLKIVGDQVITNKYHFEELQANNMAIKMLSGQDLAKLVNIKSGNYEINQSVQFTNPLNINRLEAKDSFDAIPVVDGKLQILLKDTEEVQYITAKKNVEELEILNPINLRGHIHGEELEKINPVVTIEGPLVLEGDYEITGNMTVEKTAMLGDMVSNKKYSAKRVLSHGLLLEEQEIDVHMDLQQELNVDEIFIDEVNGINPQTWVVTGTTKLQSIHGAKIFIGDVNITGNTNFFKINNIDVLDLEESIMKKTGDQVISGKQTLLKVVSTSARGNISIGQKSLDEVLTSNTDKIISGTVVIKGDVTAKTSSSENMKVEGKVKELNFNKLIEDTVVQDSERIITGYKTFKNVTVNNLVLKNREGFNGDKMVYNGDLTLNNAIVQRIHFLKTCNEVEKERFQEPSDEGKIAVVEINEPKNFDSIVVRGKVFIESDHLNNLSLRDLVEETVKVDEEHAFEDVIFGEAVCSETPVTLQGQVENVDLENLVLDQSDVLQHITGTKTFRNTVQVVGNVVLDGNVNSMNLKDVCSFVDVDGPEKEIEINGNALFVKGPHVNKISNISIQSILDHAWFSNKEVVLEQNVHFGNVTLHNYVTVKGSVDGVNITRMNEKYFSKTKPQTITGGIEFANQTVFEGDLISPSLMIEDGIVNDMKFSDLPRTILLQGEDQLFEEVVYIEELSAEELKGEYTVNNFNLESDLMRYDKENVITGHKSLNTLKTENIELKGNTTIQSVDVLDWMQNAVLKTGIFNIAKKKTFKGNTYFGKGISLQDLVNGLEFTNETILLRSITQNITGKKNFYPDGNTTIFKNLKLRGLLNDMQMSELLNDQGSEEDMIFKSPMHFQNGLTVNNINFMKTYKGKMLDDMLTDILALEKINNVTESYEKLLNMSYAINRNLKDQSFYLQYYRELQEMQNIRYIIKHCCDIPFLMSIDEKNPGRLSYYRWDKDQKMFQRDDNISVPVEFPLLKIEAFSSGRQQFLYLEYPDETFGVDGSVIGNILKVTSMNLLTFQASIKSRGIHQIRPLIVNDEECLLIIYRNEKSPDILCNFYPQGNMQHFQSLQTGNYVHGIVTTIKEIPFIILVNNNEDTSLTPQGRVEIWNFIDSKFILHQVFYLSDPPPSSVSAITYKGVHYLSIVYRGGLQQGHVDILRYSGTSDKYEQLQKITLNNPISSEFSLLPSGELVLFILGSPNKTLMVYKYEGISGFKKRIYSLSISDINGFEQFTIDKSHFVTVRNGNKIKILQAQFKGNLRESP